MSLRVTLEILPTGDEARARTIGVMVIERTTLRDDPETYNWYVITFQDSTTKHFAGKGQVIEHKYDDGAWELVRRAIENFCGTDK